MAERLHIRNSVEELAVVLNFVRADRKLVEEQLKRLRARTAKKGGLSALLSGFDLGSTVAAEAAPLGALAVAVDP